MPIEIQPQSAAQQVKPNEQVMFQFENPVISYIIGISYWSLQFANSTASYVTTIELKVHSNQVGNSVFADVSARLDGRDSKTGYSIDLSSSEIYLTCVAVTGSTADPHIMLTSAHGIPDGGASSPVQPPAATYPPSLQTAVVGGWSTSFQTNPGQSAPFDTAINRFGTSVGVSVGGGLAAIEGQVELVRDNDWGNAHGATIDGGIVCTNTQETGLVAAVAKDLQTTSSHTVTMPTDVSQVAVMLQSLVVSFGSGSGTSRRILKVGGGTSSYSFLNNVVTLNDAQAFATDGSNNQDDGESRVSLVVLGLPSS